MDGPLGNPQHLALGTGLRGWVLAEQGYTEEGIAQIQQGLAGLRAIGQELGRPYFLTLLAEAYSKGGRSEEGLTVLAEALDITHNTGECMHQAELYRLQGELLLAQEVKSQKAKSKSQKSENPHPQSVFPNPQSEAEACFLKAIEIARRQQAKSLELRATTSLARLWQQHGKQHAARDTLFAVYDWFTEGFDTKDLQEAKRLLDSLGSGG